MNTSGVVLVERKGEIGYVIEIPPPRINVKRNNGDTK